MITKLAGTENPDINGFLLDRHVAVASRKELKDNSLEIGRTLDYDYYFGMSVRPPHNSTNVCDMIRKCADDLLHSEAFELITLNVSLHKPQNTRKATLVTYASIVVVILRMRF